MNMYISLYMLMYVPVQGSYRTEGMENLQSHGMLVKVMESHGKAICFQKIKKAKHKKFEK